MPATKEEGNSKCEALAFIFPTEMITTQSFLSHSLWVWIQFSFDLGISSHNQGAAPKERGRQMIQLAVRGMQWTKRVTLVPAKMSAECWEKGICLAGVLGIWQRALGQGQGH